MNAHGREGACPPVDADLLPSRSATARRAERRQSPARLATGYSSRSKANNRGAATPNRRCAPFFDTRQALTRWIDSALSPHEAARMSIGKTANRGCLVLFALPFAAVGVGMAIWIARTLWQAAEARSWVETPAAITSAQLKSSRSSKGGTSYRVVANYTYRFANRDYTGDRVSFYSGSDNIGSFQADAYAELKKHADDHTPFRCYVNPDQPDESILYRQVRVGMLAFQSVFMLVFGGFGFGFLYGNIRGFKAAAKTKRLAEQNPGEPWKWREDWAVGTVHADRSLAAFATGFAIFWNLIAFPIAVLAGPQALQQGHHAALLVFLFPAVGVGLAIWASREAIRIRRYGASILRLASTPGVIGGRLAGVVQLSSRVQTEDGYHVTIKCTRTETTGAGKNRSTKEYTLWEEERIVSAELSGASAQTALPVLFAIPFDQPPSEPDAASPVNWRLEVKARNPGVDLAVRFAVPVFRTAESSPDFKLDDTAIRPFLAKLDPAQELHSEGVRVEASTAGTVYVFPPARFPLQAVILVFVAAIWTAGTYWIWHAAQQGTFGGTVMRATFGLFDVLIVYGTIDAWFGRGRIEVGRGLLRWRKGVFGLGHGELEAGSIREIVPVSGSQFGNSIRYAVAAVDTAGRRRKISREFSCKRTAGVFAGELSRQVLAK